LINTAQKNSIVVPSTAIRCGANFIVAEFTAGGAIAPGGLVKYGAGVERVIAVAAATDTVCIGVADLNYSALAVGSPETTNFASGDRVPVIMDGLVCVKADAAIVAGARVMVGGTTFTYVLTEAASIAGVQQGIGRCLTTAGASGDKVVVKLW